MKIECALKIEAALGEGPVWCDRRQNLYWVDIVAPAVHRFDPANQDELVTVTSNVGAVALTEGDLLLVALHHGVSLLDWQTRELQIRVILEPGSQNRLNDGKCDAKGRFWVGSMNLGEQSPTGALYRVDSQWNAKKMLDGLVISNGIGWSPDQKRMYFADSGLRKISVFDFDLEEGSISNEQPFVTSAPRGGVPDGLCVDADGCVWAAFWDGGCVVRYTPAGAIDRLVELPAPRTTNVTFGGSDLKTLYVTSARRGLDATRLSEWPLSGSIFAIEDAGAQGLPTQRFKL